MTIFYKVTNGVEEIQKTTIHTGGTIQVQATGNFDSAVLSLLISQDDLGFSKLADYERTSDSVLRIDISASCTYYFEASNIQPTTTIEVSVI